MKRRPANLKLKETVFTNLDKDLPLKLKSLSPVLDRMNEQYSKASSYQMALIVKAFLEEIRKELLLGSSINILDFASEMNIRAGVRISRFDQEKLLYNIRLRSGTPESLK